MNRSHLASLGIASVLIMTGCSNDSEEQSVHQSGPLTVRVEGTADLQLYTDTAVHAESTKTGTIAAGSHALALCFASTKSEEFSNVYVMNSETEGYTTILAFEGSKDETPTPVFDRSFEEFEQLPAC